MKVAVLVRSAFPEAGGGHTFESELVGALSTVADVSRHSFTLVTPGCDRMLPGPVKHVPLDSSFAARVEATCTQIVRALQRKALHPGSPLAIGHWLEVVLEREQPDVVWSLSPNCPALDIPYLITMWDLGHRGCPWFPEMAACGEWAAREANTAVALQRATMVLTGTQWGRQQMDRLYGVAPERTHVLPLPTPSFEPASVSDMEEVLHKHGLRPGYLFYPAQFWPHKNHVGLVRALDQLVRAHGFDQSLVLVGSDKGNREHITELAQCLGLTSRVRMLGFVPRAELAALYQGALTLTFASHLGPDNLPPLEAMSLGCPVIAADVPGAREQLGEAALFVAPTDPWAMATAAHRLIVEPELRQSLVERGRARAAQWRPLDYVNRVLGHLDAFESIRGLWR